MIRLHRGPAPVFWTRERVKNWTERWLAKNCDSSRWSWPQFRRRGINKYAVEAMESWHYNKCAFCETPLFSGREVEHFRSKTRYPLSALVWRNLFLTCRDCNQRKGSDEHAGCIKPDCEDPEQYLWVNPISLKMEPKPGISAVARQRAIKTIELYGLDRPELSKLYQVYLQQVVFGRTGLDLMRQVFRSSSVIFEELPIHQAQLQALVDPPQPFSLMVKSLLAR